MQYSSTVETETLHLEIKKKLNQIAIETNTTNHRNDSKYIHVNKVAVKI